MTYTEATTMSVKLRKVGSSKVLTVPNEIDAKLNTEYDVFKGRDGSIIFTPKQRNPFIGDWYHQDLHQTSEFEDVTDIDIELNHK